MDISVSLIVTLLIQIISSTFVKNVVMNLAQEICTTVHSYVVMRAVLAHSLNHMLCLSVVIYRKLCVTKILLTSCAIILAIKNAPMVINALKSAMKNVGIVWFFLTR